MDTHLTAGLSPGNRAALAAELLPGETLLWAAEPSSGMRVAGFAIWLVAIPFVGFGLPFLGVGLIALWKPFSLRKAADNTVFAFTDTRLIRLQHGRTRAVSEVPMDSIGSVDMVEYSDGSGTLTIQALGPPEAEGKRRPIALYQIMGVKDVARARTLLRERLAAIGA